jgi:uncharacterized phage protein (TIGR01671 family)
MWTVDWLSRDIKFKLRNKKEKNMYKSYDILDISLDYTNWMWGSSDEICFLQYTWLKDKNWIEIYEGDIVEHIWWKTREWKKVLEVVAYWMQLFQEDSCLWYNLDDWKYEVIWNIFEHPELLEKTHETTTIWTDNQNIA